MNDLTSLGRILIVAGAAVAALGTLVVLAGRAGVPLGRLPGDVRIATGGATCVIPLATSLLVSLLLTVILNLVIRLLNR